MRTFNWKIAAFIGLVAFVSGFFATRASAQETPDTVTIYTGSAGGGYDSRARVIAQRLEQRGVNVVIENMNGSDEITLAACRDPHSMWVAQKDALYVREVRDGCALVDLALYGDEVAAIFFPPDSRLNELSDLDSAHTVLVDRLGSGTDLAWRTMVSIEVEHGRSDDWTEAQVEYGQVRRATSLATRGRVHAVVLVRRANSPEFQMLVDQGWSLGELYDRDINDLKYGSNELYEAIKVDFVDASNKRHKDDGYRIPSFIGTTEIIERDFPDLFDLMLGATE